jgi:hypothetical protein
MLTGAPTAPRMPVTPSPRRRVWPWAAGSILITLAVIAATLVGHRLAAQHRLASEVAPAPALPPLAVQVIAHALGPINQLTLDQQAQTLVAQVQTQPCPHIGLAPIPGCVSSDQMQAGLVFYNSATGAVRGQAVKPTAEAGDVFALTDSAHGVTYLLDDSGVTIYDDAAGKQTGGYASQLGAHAQTVALDDQLGLIYALSDQNTLNAFDAASGRLVATLATPSLGLPQLLADTSASRLYLVGLNGADQPTMLYAFNASDLSSLGSWSLPAGLQMFGFDSATHSLYLSSGSAPTVSRLDLATLPASQPNGPGAQSVPANPSRVPALKGASRFGVDGATGVVAMVNGAGVEALATGAPQPYALLPLVRESVDYGAENLPWLLPVDSQAGRVYLVGDDNTILIVSLARPTSHAAPNALTAEVIARAGMAALLPDTNQNPPFLSAQTFPVGAGQVSREYFVHYSDLGWQGPYHGTASLGAVKAGVTAGDYTMTFSVAWNQLFLRQHSWTVEVTPDGRTHLLADSGDAIP